MRILLPLALILLTGLRPLAAQVPTFADVTGHDFGERITLHHEMVRYLETLAETSDRVRIVRQGTSWEGRDLMLAIVTAPENYARLEAIRQTAVRLNDPRQTPAEEAERLIADQPVILWFGGSIHGFELSGTEGVLKLLEHLTTRDDAETRTALANTVILLDPMINPDGREAFAQVNHARIGARVNPSRKDWNNDFTSFEALTYRTGHYFFDTNRDWFAHTQPETRARAATIQAWRPQVMVDLHEMGSDVEFFFDPPAEPFGSTYPAYARRWYPRFGQAYAEAFDSAGYEYLTRERYNYLYPGYTGSYGSYQGAIGMLYEQGSTRGLAITRADETVRHLSDAIAQQYTAAWAAVRLAAAEREALLREYYEAHVAAVEAGRRGTRRYLLPPGGDPNHVAELVNLLLRSGVEVQTLTEATTLEAVRDRTGATVGRRRFPEGTFVIDTAQPRHHLIEVLLGTDVTLEQRFLDLARLRLDRDENPRFYDITGWSLPLLFNVEAYRSEDGRALLGSLVTEPVRTEVPLPERAGYAYLIDGRQAAGLAALYHLRAAGHRVAVITRPTRIEGRTFASGTVIVRTGQNDDSVHEAVREVAARYRLDVVPVGTGLSPEGFPALGSGDFTIHARLPSIALVAEDPIQAYSFGWAWHTLDRQYDVPTTVLRMTSLGRTDLSDFNVLVLPEVYDTTRFKTLLGTAGLSRLKQWVRDGGTLVAIGRAIEAARGPLDLLELASWYEEEEHEHAQRITVPGAVYRARLDTLGWLASGYDDPDLPVLVYSDRLYRAPEGPPSSSKRVAARLAGEAPTRLAGFAWPEADERLPGSVFVYEQRIGQGRVIAFAEDPNFRGYWRGADRLFLNAVLLGPSAP
ncbi:MAG: hypothetical protein D6685_07510 [Bacteroidetes bacterium]|nr:MAG: hypothetical protein D6685_07510 [Bacteroidota bacterium]